MGHGMALLLFGKLHSPFAAHKRTAEARLFDKGIINGMPDIKLSTAQAAQVQVQAQHDKSLFKG